MTNKKFSILGISVIAAALVGLAVPPAYAGVTFDEEQCDRLLDQVIDKLDKGQLKAAQKLSNTYFIACFDQVPAACNQLFTELFWAFITGNEGKFEAIGDVLEILECDD